MKYIIFDLEATCCAEKHKYFESEIIEIGAVKLNSDLQQVDTFDCFIRPVINPVLTDFCKELTTIKQSDVDNAARFDQVCRDFIKWIGDGEYWLCSWGQYDKNQFIKECRRNMVDSGWLYNHISLKHQHGAKVLNKANGGVGMGKALELIKQPLTGTHHRGIDDALNIAKIFKYYFNIWDFK